MPDRRRSGPTPSSGSLPFMAAGSWPEPDRGWADLGRRVPVVLEGDQPPAMHGSVAACVNRSARIYWAERAFAPLGMPWDGYCLKAGGKSRKKLSSFPSPGVLLHGGSIFHATELQRMYQLRVVLAARSPAAARRAIWFRADGFSALHGATALHNPQSDCGACTGSGPHCECGNGSEANYEDCISGRERRVGGQGSCPDSPHT